MPAKALKVAKAHNPASHEPGLNVMRKLSAVTSAILIGALLLGSGVSLPSRAALAAPSSAFSYSSRLFGRISVFRPAGQPRATALFLSGDGGWNVGTANIARDLAQHGILVAGVSTPVLMASLERSGAKCINPNYALVALARDVQHRLGVKAYMKPIIMGYSAGATLAYGALAQWPNGGYRGVFSLGFSNDMPGRKPWCHAPGFNVRPTMQPARGWLFAPNPKITVPWVVLQGGRDKVVSFHAARQFVAAVPGARMIALPTVDHAFADRRLWMPQMFAALAPMLNPPSGTLAGDLPLNILPAASGGTGHDDEMAVVYSGDGGWVGLDRDIAGELAARGIPVVGVDSLSYFWSARTPAGAARDLSQIMASYSARWHRPKVMLIGYSFGADTLPAIVGSLDRATRAHVQSVSLLGLSATADFQFHLASWLNFNSSEALPTIPAIMRLKGMNIRCVRGAQESESACGEIPSGTARIVTVPGGHHFERNAALLTRIIMA